MAWPNTFRTDTPSGQDDPAEGDDRIREAKAAIQERLDVDHYWEASSAYTHDDEHTGQHRKVTFREAIDAPELGSGERALFVKLIDEVPELCWLNDQGEVLQLTRGGLIHLTSETLFDILANNTFFTAKNSAGDGQVNLIKADAGDVPILGENCKTYSAGAPTHNQHVPNKKYVDDLVTAIQEAYVKVSDVKTNHGGTIGTATWWTRDLTTIDHDPLELCSLADNKITLAAGTYRCLISCPGYNIERHVTRLYNVTIGSEQELIRGTSEWSHSTTSRSVICGRFTVADAQSLEVQHYCSNGVETYGLGYATLGMGNVYTIAEFWKV